MANPKLTIEIVQSGGEKVTRTLKEIEKQGSTTYTRIIKDGKLYSETIRKTAFDLEKMGRTLTTVGATLTRNLSLPLTLAAGGIIKLGMDAQETRNLVEQTFKDMTKSVEDWSRDSSASLVNTRLEVQRQAGIFFQMGTAIGLARDASLSMSEQLVELASDMASFRNLKPEEAFEKIQAALSGEVEPMKRLGIVINDTAVKNEALRLGWIKQGQTLSEQQKYVLRFNLLLKATGDDQGDLRRTADSTTNQLRIQKAQFLENATALGESLIPVMDDLLKNTVTPLVKKFGELVETYNGLDPGAQRIVQWSTAAMIALGPLVSTVGYLIKAFQFIGGAGAAAGAFASGSSMSGAAALGGAAAGAVAWAWPYTTATNAQEDAAMAQWQRDQKLQQRPMNGLLEYLKGGPSGNYNPANNPGGGGSGKGGGRGKTIPSHPYDFAIFGDWGGGDYPGSWDVAHLEDQLPSWFGMGPIGRSRRDARRGMNPEMARAMLGGDSLGDPRSRWLGLPDILGVGYKGHFTRNYTPMSNWASLSKAFGGQGLAAVAGGLFGGGLSGGLGAAGSIAGNALLPGIGGLLGGLLGGGLGKLFGGHKKPRGETPGQPVYVADVVQQEQLRLLTGAMLGLIGRGSRGIDNITQRLANQRAGVGASI